MSRKDRLYNYMVNTFGISKEKILEYVDLRIEDVLAKHVRAKLDSGKIERIITNQIIQTLKTGIPDGRYPYYGKDQLETVISQYIGNEVARVFREEYKFEGKVVRKDAKGKL